MIHHRKWMLYAHRQASQSKDPSTRVGAVIIHEDYEPHVLGDGHNDLVKGTPQGFWNDRDKKYKHVVHAELMAILQAGEKTKGATIYITHHPCSHCAVLIVQAGITTAVYPAKPWRDDFAVLETCKNASDILRRAGVKQIHV
jgi:dCMP deaminase